MNKQALIEEIRWELSQLNRLTAAARELAAVPEERRDPWDAAAAAKYVADVFRGLENLCKRRSVYLGEPWPDGPDSHARILADFIEDPTLGGRLALEIAERLKQYKGFRHRFLHAYAFETRWEMVDEPLRLIPETIDALTAVWEHWIEELPDDSGT
jgi:hypothetical protein